MVYTEIELEKQIEKELAKKFEKLKFAPKIDKKNLEKFDLCAGWSGNKDIFYKNDGTLLKKV